VNSEKNGKFENIEEIPTAKSKEDGSVRKARSTGAYLKNRWKTIGRCRLRLSGLAEDDENAWAGKGMRINLRGR